MADEKTVEQLTQELAEANAARAVAEEKSKSYETDTINQRLKYKKARDGAEKLEKDHSDIMSRLEGLKEVAGIDGEDVDLLDALQEKIIGEQNMGESEWKSKFLARDKEAKKLTREMSEFVEYKDKFLASNKQLLERDKNSIMAKAAIDAGINPEHQEDMIAIAKVGLNINYDEDNSSFYVEDNKGSVSSLSDAVIDLANTDRFSVFKSKETTGLGSRANSSAAGNKSIYDPENHDHSEYMSNKDYRKAALEYQTAQDNK